LTDQERQADIALLAGIAAGEHAAIIQYMTHRFYAGEGDIGCEVEEIARREMLHWKWINEHIRELGGEPALERGPINIAGPDVASMMQADVELEEHCMREYEQAIAKTSNPALKRQFEHHLRDERGHREDFAKLVIEAREQAASGAEPHVPTEEEQAIIAMLNSGVAQEYAAVLQYLHQSMATDDLKVSRATLNVAIEEMKHMAQLADEVVPLGGTPAVEPDVVKIDTDDAGRLKTNVADEDAAGQLYQSQIDSLATAGKPEISDLLALIRDQETFHRETFEDLLRHAQAGAEDSTPPPKPQGPMLTVGSLLGQPQDQ